MPGLSELQSRVKTGAKGQLPSVERWNPPYCGDIGLAINADASWSYQASPIGRMRLVRLFARILRKDEDGCHYLVTPVEKILVNVADAPFLAVGLEARGAGRSQILTFRTNVDDVVTADADHPLRFVTEPGNGGLKPYLNVRGSLEALVSRAVTYDLVASAIRRHRDAQVRANLYHRPLA